MACACWSAGRLSTQYLPVLVLGLVRVCDQQLCCSSNGTTSAATYTNLAHSLADACLLADRQSGRGATAATAQLLAAGLPKPSAPAEPLDQLAERAAAMLIVAGGQVPVQVHTLLDRKQPVWMPSDDLLQGQLCRGALLEPSWLSQVRGNDWWL